MWGIIIGAIIGNVFYFFRGGGIFIIRDAQMGLHVLLIQAVLYAIVPGALGAFIGWLISK